MYRMSMMNTNDKYAKVIIEGKVSEDQLRLIFQGIAALPSELLKSMVVDTIVSESTRDFTCTPETCTDSLFEPQVDPDIEYEEEKEEEEESAALDVPKPVTNHKSPTPKQRRLFNELVTRYCAALNQNEGQVREYLNKLGIRTIQELSDSQDETIQKGLRQYQEYI